MSRAKGSALMEAVNSLRDRDSRIVDNVIGPRKPGSPETSNIDWSECPLAKRYPTWSVFLQALSEERKQALLERREPHPAAAPPLRGPITTHRPNSWDNAPQLTASQANRMYGTTDRGR